MRGLLALAVALAAAAPARAQDCLTTTPAPPAVPAHALRFGITPQEAGRLTGQGEIRALAQGDAIAALGRLKPPGRALVLRLNRLFWSDGDAGIRTFAERVATFGRAGLPSEVQIRYHPPAGGEGDIAAWVTFVRGAVRALAAERATVAVSITNEGNLPVSPNTSDGAYAGVVDALVQGVTAAREEADAAGRPDLEVGFTLMWRWRPDSDAKFWQDIGAKATPAFRRALDYVGMQIYPGLVWPPQPLPGRSAGTEVVEALTLVRECYMPKAGIGRDVDLWVSENGYATNLGRNETTQVADLESTVRDVHRWSGALGATDYRYFNLRDNDSAGSDLFDAVGLLRDDLTEKPAFATLRGLAAELGTAAAASTGGGRPRARLTVLVRRRGAHLRVSGRVLRGPVLPASACRGRVTITLTGPGVGRSAGRIVRRRAGLSCRYAASAGVRRRGAITVRVRFGGNGQLAPASARARSR